MNAKDRINPNTPPAPSARRRFLQYLEDWWSRQTKIAVASHMGGIFLWILGWFNYAIHLAALQLHGHPSLAGERFFCKFLPWITLVFFAMWTFLCFRWRKVRQGDKKVTPQTFLFTGLITLWLSLFMVVSPCAAAGSGQTNNVPQVSQTARGASTPAANNPHPNILPCEVLLYILWLLAAAAAVYISFLHYCDLFGWCGHTNKKPPQSPGNNTNQTKIALSPLTSSLETAWLINTNIGLPAISFAVRDGVVVSNSTGLAVRPFPSFFSMNGTSVEPGGFIFSTQPGITTPPSVSVWDETNFYADSNLDPVYPYVVLFNYTMITSTNLVTDWHELYTVIGWVNSNPSVPLTCMITYTNGVPETTNWSQTFLDQNHQPTNIVVYGVLPSCDTNSAFAIGAVHPADGITPPGGGGTNGVFSSSAQFFRLTCNTNDIVTSWP